MLHDIWNYLHNTHLGDSLPLLGVSNYTFKRCLKEHPIRSSRGVDIQTPQRAVLKHPIFNSEIMVFGGRQKITSFHYETKARKVMVDFKFDALYR